jgi:hypothetical protein
VENTEVTLTASNASGSLLADWGGACAPASGKTCTLMVNAPLQATANFMPGYYVTVTVSGSQDAFDPISEGDPPILCTPGPCPIGYQWGTVNVAQYDGPSIIDCANSHFSGTKTCEIGVPDGTTITFTETNGEFRLLISKFAGWGGDCSVAGLQTTCSRTIHATTTVSASFKQ